MMKDSMIQSINRTQHGIETLFIIIVVLLCLVPCVSAYPQVIGGHEYVDLGLPSGTLWAKCNIGAKTDKDPGTFFAWGETMPKKQYTLNTYKFVKAQTYFHQVKQVKYVYTKYNTDKTIGVVDNKKELDSNDDAAVVQWGDCWCMPTVDQFEELEKHCKYSVIHSNGREFIKFTGKNNNYILFPVYGHMVGGPTGGPVPYLNQSNSNTSSLLRGGSFYWTKTVDAQYPERAVALHVGEPLFKIVASIRERGYNIKPVVSKKGLAQIPDLYDEYAKSGEVFTVDDLFPFDVRTYYIIGQYDSKENAISELSNKIESKYKGLKVTPKMVKAYQEGNGTLANFLLGYCYYKGLGAVRDLDASLQYFQEGSVKGDHRCTVMMFALGFAGPNHEGDMELLSSASSQGYLPAKMITSYLQATGPPNRVFSPNILKSDSYAQLDYRKSIDYTLYPEAYYIWGKMTNNDNAISLAAYNGLTYVIRELVLKYDNARQYEEAYKYLQIAEKYGVGFDETLKNRVKVNALAKSEKASDVAIAIRDTYNSGAYRSVISLYNNSLSRNVVNGDIIAYYVLASQKLGINNKQDEVQYFNMIKNAAEEGSVIAMEGLAESYEKGFGIDAVDMNNAIIWYRKAAQGGSTKAKNYLTKRNLKW